ncbi:MAG: hypothetical protein KA059_04950 [Elusimicrobiales bacterium]|nr:hypothetical protein [Elusimicrobiales bacterium]
MTNKKTLYICSAGMNKGDLTFKTIDILRKSEIVINNVIEEKELMQLGIKKIITTNDKFMIKKGKYLNIIAKKLFSKYNTISILTNGNPLFLNDLMTSIVSEFAKKNNLTDVIITPGISTFDYLIDNIAMNLNIFSDNVLLISHPDMLFSFNKKLTYYDLILYYPDFINNKHLEFIKSIYKQKDKFYLITIKSFNIKSSIKSGSIGEIERIIKNLDNYTTLLIPHTKVNIKTLSFS